jgi:antitoxin (DNA-binding transcriptional repressor) of toxin-antitoxin stability system
MDCIASCSPLRTECLRFRSCHSDLDRIGSLGTTKRAEPTQTRVALYMVWHLCYTEGMQREITQRELRNESGAIMRALDAGESFIVTRNGVPVAEMTPARRPRFTSKADVLKAFANAPSIDAKRFFSDVDAILD